MSFIYLILFILSCVTTYIWGRADERDKWININRKLEQQGNHEPK